MPEQTNTEGQRQRAAELREQVEQLRRGATSAPDSPRDFTDRAAQQASEGE